MAYADYEFYRDVYFGDAITEDDFPQLSERASDYIRAMTQGVSDTVTGWQMEAVKKATCAIADIMQDEKRMSASAFSGDAAISSETVGSWSRTYRSTSISSAEVEYINGRKRDALLLYLGNLAAFAPLFKVRSYPCQHRT